MNPYEDINHLARRVSVRHKPMPAEARAAQLAPFAALTGFEGTIQETERVTEGRIHLSEAEKDLLDEKLMLLASRLEQRTCVTAVYYVPDERKAGGRYEEQTGAVRKIDAYEKKLIFENGTEIPVERIVRMDGEIFRGWGELL